MGGHGALTLALKNPLLFKSVSAFAPMCNPTASGMGRNALLGYLGPNEEDWLPYDASRLLASPASASFDDILVDIGTADEFLESGDLRPEALEAAAHAKGQKLTLRRQEGFDHSYFFVSTFMPDHIEYHARKLL